VDFEAASGTSVPAVGALHDEFVTLTAAERLAVEFGLHDRARARAHGADTYRQRSLNRSRRQLDAIDLDVSHGAVRQIRERRGDRQCLG
jgi:hypothetical protein